MIRPHEWLVCVTVGRLVNQKGHVYLVEAAPEVVRAHPNVRFLLLGDGPLEAELRVRIAALGLTEYFVFAGMSESVAEELAGADIMIHPSVEEPFGIAVLESMRAGLPIVASRVGGIPEVVGNGAAALLCEPGDAAMLADGVKMVLGDEELKERMGRDGRERFLSEFKVDRMRDRVERYVHGLLLEAKHGKA
jgi:glycosyltransferase involved in cell wall biosynthesis